MSNYGAVATAYHVLLESAAEKIKIDHAYFRMAPRGTSTVYSDAIGINASDVVTSTTYRHLRPEHQRARPTAAEENGDGSTRADQIFSQAGAE